MDVQGVSIVVDDDTPGVEVDPVTGTVMTNNEDGSVTVELDKVKTGKDDDTGHFANLATKMGAGELDKIAIELWEQVEADDKSRANTLEIRARAMDFLGLEIKEPRANVGDTSASVEGMATVTNPLLLEACLKAWANSEAEFLPSEGPVKIDQTNPGPQTEEDLAEILERDCNFFFTDVMSEYYPDTSHMLLWGTSFGGCGIKKIYRCPLLRRPTSQSIDIKDFIVSDTTKDLKSCARITHNIEMRPSIMKRMMLAGYYRDIELQPPGQPAPGAIEEKVASIQGTNPTLNTRPEDQPYILWETQCELDIPEYAPGKFKGEGVPLPYLVTMDKQSKQILALRRDWREDDEDCQRKRLYVKYPYIPGPGFYGTGLLNVLGNSSAAMTAAWREALDAGMFANFPAFLVSKLSARQNTSDFRVGPGTGVPLETNGMPINQVASAMPYRDVTPGLLALMDKIQQQAGAVGQIGEIPSAEGIQNVPVGTMLAQIEQATKVISAVHRDQYKAQAEEIGMVLDLLREDPEAFWSGNKLGRDYWNEQKLLQALDDYNLVPRADPNTPSHIHRVAKALALTQLFNVPAFAPRLNVDEALKRILGAIKEDANALLLPPPAPAPPMPNPQLIAAQAKATSAQASVMKAQADGMKAQTDADNKQQELQTQRDVATTSLAKELVAHSSQTHHNTAQLGLDAVQAAHNAKMDVAQHSLDVAQHNLNAQGQQHQQNQDEQSTMFPEEPNP